MLLLVFVFLFGFFFYVQGQYIMYNNKASVSGLSSFPLKVCSSRPGSRRHVVEIWVYNLPPKVMHLRNAMTPAPRHSSGGKSLSDPCTQTSLIACLHVCGLLICVMCNKNKHYFFLYFLYIDPNKSNKKKRIKKINAQLKDTQWLS